MKTYLLKAGVRQAIAKAGETDIAVAYNAKAWMDEYPAGNPQLMVTTPGGKRVPVTVETVDNLITGQVPNELLAGPGVYSYVFVWTSGSTQLESGRCECLVLGSSLANDLVHDSRRTPEWAERIFLAAEVIEGAVNGAMEARNTAADMAAEAAESEANAAESAEEAEDSAELADQKATAAHASAEDAAASAAAMHPENYVAQAFSASSAYSAGTYVMHDGYLYRLTADHDADVTWENTAKVQVKVADDVGDLKSAVSNIIYEKIDSQEAGTKYGFFSFVSGETYNVTNGTSGNIHFYTKTDGSSSGTIVDVVGENITAGKTVTFTASGDAPAYQVYRNATGNVLIEKTNTSIYNINDAIGWVTPEQYGAKGDGVTDDTTAFNSALSASPCVHLLSKTYYIAGTVTMSDQQKLIGETPQTYKKLSTMLFGANGSLTVSGGGCAIEKIEFYGANCNGTASTYTQNAVVLNRVSPNYDIDITINGCGFIGFSDAIVCNGRGLKVQNCGFTYYENAIKLNFVGASDGTISTNAKYGGRGFVIQNNRFHTAEDTVSADANIVVVPQGAVVCGLTFTGNYCDGLCGHISVSGDVRGGQISDNVLVYPERIDGAFIQSSAGSNMFDVVISDNVLEAKSLYDLTTYLPDTYISLNGVADGITIDGNSASYSKYSAIVFGSYAKNIIISNNSFYSLYADDAAAGCAVKFTGICNNIAINNNIYEDTFYGGKTHDRYLAYFTQAQKCIGVALENNKAIKGGTVDLTNISTSSTMNTIDGALVKIAQTSNYGTAIIPITGLDASTQYTISFVLADLGTSTAPKYRVRDTGTYDFGADIVTGLNKATSTSSADGELYLMIRPHHGTGYDHYLYVDQIRIIKGTDADTDDIDVSNMA